ncbi:hypothetical protein GIB67_014709 [Kingdonia uniflora]|uniref:3'-5' exonuclease domain-containing protein n=1 Tax=Kingdonia uniflora TaxID=39325 RepID=A0A7J7NV76_9MAGN|nr:hypothetical protein GIB67_014709 [Kingdonia uniflora]
MRFVKRNCSTNSPTTKVRPETVISKIVSRSLASSILKSSFFFELGLKVGDDVAKLRNEYGLNSGRHADIHQLAKMRWPGRFSHPGLKDLAREVVGLYIAKPIYVTLSNWENGVLDDYQIEYACINFYASYKIGQKLLVEG